MRVVGMKERISEAFLLFNINFNFNSLHTHPPSSLFPLITLLFRNRFVKLLEMLLLGIIISCKFSLSFDDGGEKLCYEKLKNHCQRVWRYKKGKTRRKERHHLSKHKMDSNGMANTF
jgi:hypothetical protein